MPKNVGQCSYRIDPYVSPFTPQIRCSRPLFTIFPLLHSIHLSGTAPRAHHRKIGCSPPGPPGVHCIFTRAHYPPSHYKQEYGRITGTYPYYYELLSQIVLLQSDMP